MESAQIGWLAGDGGPPILIQRDIAPKWQGAADFDNSLMNGGEIETDYDVICAEEGCRVIRHRDRDMVVLKFCEYCLTGIDGNLPTLSQLEVGDR